MGATPTGVKLWLGGIVPYEINADLGNIVAIKDAIKTLEQQTLGNPNSKLGRKGGRQFVNASLNDWLDCARDLPCLGHDARALPQ
jgi:hypothetical protein